MSSPERRSLLSGLLRIPGSLLIATFGLTVLAIAWLFVAQHLKLDRATEIQRIYRENNALAQAFEEHVRRVLHTADTVLLFLKLEHDKHGRVTDAMIDFVDRSKLDPFLNQIAVVDAGGNLLLSAVPAAKPVNVSRNESFRVHAESDAAGLYVGKPILTEITKTWSFFLTRRLNRADGSFAGTVAVALDPAYFSRFYERLDLGPDRGVLLVGRDGIVRARRFQQQTGIGQDLRSSPMFARIPNEPAGHYEVLGGIDQQQRFVSYRALPDFPLVVAVSDLTASALAPFGRRRAENLRSAVFFTLLVALFCATMIAAGRHERRQSKALRETGDRYRDLFENANDAVFLLDEQLRYVDANRRATEIFGYARGEFIGHTVFEFLPPEQLPNSEAAFRELVQRGHYDGFDGRMRAKDGRFLDIEVSSSAIMRNGVFAGSRDIVRDITERKHSVEKLMMSERRLRESQEVARIGNWSWNVATNALDWSEEAFRRFDKDPATFTPTVEYFVDRIHPEDRDATRQAMQATLEHNAPYHIQPRIRNESGREWVLEGFGRVERGADGTPVQFAGTVQDITEHQRAEEQIRQSERFIRSILDTVDEGFIVVDRDYRILTANKAYSCQTSRAGEEVLGRHCYEVSHKAGRPCFEMGEECAVRQVFETGKPHTTVHKHPGADGQVLFVETKAFPIKDEAGNTTSVIETLNNITEKHLLEEERLKTQKLESIGTLAGGIAHDFNNLLQGIFGYISMAKLFIDQKERSLAMIEQAEKALHQSVSLTTQLLTFSKGGKPVREPMRLEPLLENAVKFALSGSRTEYRLTTEPDLWLVDADAGQLGQVIQNIAMNADQAMPSGGCMEITARNVPPSAPELPQGLARRDYVAISISDRGVGIPEQDLDRIFDPYFTTKERGSGLGLATSYSIVRNHEGRIVATSEVGKGSTFVIYLPAAAAEPAVPTDGAAARGTAAASILVMDDEAIIRDVAQQLLKVLGHAVVTVDRGETAIAAFQSARDAGRPFDMVILDLTIRGGMGGVETMRKLHEIDPEVKAIASSGYSDDATQADHRAQGFAAFLKKPYNIRQLQDILGTLSAQQPSPPP